MQNSKETLVSKSLFNKITGLYLATLQKRKDSNTGVLWWILWNIWEKNNVQQKKNVLISLKKNTLKKGGKLETTGKNDTRSKKLKALLTSSLHILALLKNSFSPLFSASDDTLKARFFKKTMQSNWGFVYYRKLFLIFSNLTLVSVTTRIFVRTNNKRM